MSGDHGGYGGIPKSGPVRVLRDGKDVSGRLDNPDAAFAWLLHHQPMSVDWALTYEGYTVVKA